MGVTRPPERSIANKAQLAVLVPLILKVTVDTVRFMKIWTPSVFKVIETQSVKVLGEGDL
jgi:hypothetical protein